MAKFVPDVNTQRWIVVSPSRVARPEDTSKPNIPIPAGQKIDPFAPGNEHLTPPEVYRVGAGEANKQGWKIRVVPNKFPITDIHEVVIHSPDAEKDIEQFELSHVEDLLLTYKQRYLFHHATGYVLIFANHGEQAGASLSHPHSQIVVIPRQIKLDALALEPINNLVEESEHFFVYCPDFSQWPYEVWLAPKIQEQHFSDITSEALKDMARLMKSTLCRLHAAYDHPDTRKIRANLPFAYNYYIYHGQNWYLRIIPRLVHRAGFELGTGLSVNIIDPKDAAVNLSSNEFCKIG